jgi:hypothetical protein
MTLMTVIVGHKQEYCSWGKSVHFAYVTRLQVEENKHVFCVNQNIANTVLLMGNNVCSMDSVCSLISLPVTPSTSLIPWPVTSNRSHAHRFVVTTVTLKFHDCLLNECL